MIGGDIIGVIAMTEPGIGSDLRSMCTTIRRDGNDYIVNESKMFMTNGFNSDLAVVACKTDPAGKKLTLVCIEDGTPRFTAGNRLEKIGFKGQDTSELSFDHVRVPVANRLGEEDAGFGYLSHRLAWERLMIGNRAVASIRRCLPRRSKVRNSAVSSRSQCSTSRTPSSASRAPRPRV